MHNLTHFLVTWGKPRGRVIDTEPSFLIQGPAMWTRAVARGERTGGNKKDIQEVDFLWFCCELEVEGNFN